MPGKDVKEGGHNICIECGGGGGGDNIRSCF
jgi:hypothetical protein